MHILDLAGDWTLRRTDSDTTFRASVPGCVHLDLLASGEIPDPYYRDHETNLQWIGETDWVYVRDVVITNDLIDRDQVLLHCDGLDTFAHIAINGKDIARTDNMHRTWEFDVKRHLREGVNRIEIRFESVLPYIRRRQQERAIDPHCAPREIPGRAWVRKEPCNFGWDWGSVLVTCGIWRDIRIVAFDIACIADVHVTQDHSREQSVAVNVGVAAEVVRESELSARITLSLGGNTVASAIAVMANGWDSAELIVDSPDLWWPNGMGDHPLYDLRVELVDPNGGVLDVVTKRIGLRTLELARDDDEWGESFCFAVNGVRFFAKGMNWIPADTFAPRVTRDDYARLLSDAAAVHANMIRVWGGGYYESDTFYDLCDELGLCVWQDFMFSCSAYPSFDREYMDNVRIEGEENVRRLRHHPSIALWCGNNEVEWLNAGDVWTDTKMSWSDYTALFDDLLAKVVSDVDPERAYWPSSPHTPHGDRADANRPDCGDAHLWDVWHGRKPFSWYRGCLHRFVSEFGFQSFPHPKTIESFTIPSDRNVSSYVMEHHQRSGIGNTMITANLLDWLRMPDSFEGMVWLSQIVHALAMKTGVEHWRRNMPRTMGALYWQLNDCWPVASWSSIDYAGRWKALHYMARRFFAPLLVSAIADDGNVEITVTNDLREACEGRFRWSLMDLNGAVIERAAFDVTITPQASRSIVTLDLADSLRRCGVRNVVLWIYLDAKEHGRSSDMMLFAPPKHIDWPEPDITRTVRTGFDGGYCVRLLAKRPTLWVWIDLDGLDARYSDNFVHLVPGIAMTIEVQPADAITQVEFVNRLRVRSIADL